MNTGINITDFQVIGDKLYIAHDLYMWWLQSLTTSFLFGLFFGVALILIYEYSMNRMYNKKE